MPKTVVIADDHPSFRASARAILQSEGFEVVGEAEDGESAIELARTLSPDVLLLDVQLPDMDGLAAGGFVLAAVGTAFVLTSDHEDNKGAFLSLALTVGLSFLISGVIALWRRPDNRTGVLLIAVAYLW